MHRSPSSLKYPNSAGAISLTQQRESISLFHHNQPDPVTHTPTNKRIHSPTPESWAAAAAAGAWGISLHTQPLPRFPQQHHPEEAAGMGRWAKMPVPCDPRPQGARQCSWGVQSLQILPGKSLRSEQYFQHGTSKTPRHRLSRLTSEERTSYPETEMKVVPGSGSGFKCIRFLRSWKRKENITC